MQLDDLQKLAANPENVARAIELAQELTELNARRVEIMAELEMLGVNTEPAAPEAPQRVARGGRPVVVDTRPQPIAVPAEFQDLHKQCWSQGVEVVFLADGTAAIRGEVVTLEELSSRVRKVLEAA